MTDRMSKLIEEKSFPQTGDLFGPVFITQTRDEIDARGVAVKVSMEDRSYREAVFRCISSDAVRVVGVKVFGYMASDRPTIFHRDEWRLDDVRHLADALGIKTNKQEPA